MEFRFSKNVGLLFFLRRREGGFSRSPFCAWLVQHLKLPSSAMEYKLLLALSWKCRSKHDLFGDQLNVAAEKNNTCLYIY